MVVVVVTIPVVLVVVVVVHLLAKNQYFHSVDNLSTVEFVNIFTIYSIDSS